MYDVHIFNVCSKIDGIYQITAKNIEKSTREEANKHKKSANSWMVHKGSPVGGVLSVYDGEDL